MSIILESGLIYRFFFKGLLLDKTPIPKHYPRLICIKLFPLTLHSAPFSNRDCQYVVIPLLLIFRIQQTLFKHQTVSIKKLQQTKINTKLTDENAENISKLFYFSIFFFSLIYFHPNRKTEEKH